MENSVERHAKAIRNKVTPLKNCVGFIDRTNREIARPIHDQNMFYSGHKHVHSIKFQSSIFHLFGPVNGKRHDVAMWNMSGVEEIMCASAFDSYC
jgi:hypothetical protein